MPAATAAELTDDLVDEVLLRFPPHEPERLVRAALVCKRWCRLISDPGFRRRFREFHRSPPMLGFLYARTLTSFFVPTSSIRLPHAPRGNWKVADSRHGRVLFYKMGWAWENNHPRSEGDLVVWDPITDAHRELPKLPGHLFARLPCSWAAAVLCAAAGSSSCNHVDCQGGPFLVVLVCTAPRETFTCVYSSEAGAWSEPASAQLRRAWVHLTPPSVLVENALYFMSGDWSRRSIKVLKHDLGTKETSLIRLPRTGYERIELTKTMDGGLAFAAVHESKLYVWSRVADHEGYAGWAQSRAIELETLPWPGGSFPASLDVACYVDGAAAVFVGKDGAFFADLKSCRVKRVCEDRVYAVVPYMSFYVPAPGAVASIGKAPEAVISSA